MPRRFNRPELDALRFFAFACVFIHHTPLGQFPRAIKAAGSFGMSIFFMLSSYLIVTILLREHDETGSISWRRFAARRLLRIWPLYFAVLFSLYALGRYVPFLKVNGHAVFAFSVLLGNVYPGHLRVCEQFPE